MSAANGVQGIIACANPKAVNMNCNSHVLDLYICHTPAVKDMNGVINKLAQFFWNSSLIPEGNGESLEKDVPEAKITRLKPRWPT